MAETKMTKGVSNRLLLGRYVASSLGTHGEATVRAFFTRFPGFDTLDPTAVLGFLQAVVGLLDKTNAELERLELAYVAELADDVKPRETRDEKNSLGQQALSRARDVIYDVLGESGLRTYGLSTPVPRVPDEVSSRLANTINLLSKIPQTVKDILGHTFDTATVATALSEIHTPLAKALSDLVVEERERQDAINARDVGIDTWTDVYQGVTMILAGFYLISGMRGLYEKLRPTVRRTSGRLDDADIEALTAESEAPAETPAEPTAPTEGTETP